MDRDGVSGRVPGWMWRALAITAVVIAGIISVNITTLLHDAVARHGLPAWKAVTWEASSGVMLVLCAVVPLLALRHAPPERERWRRVLGVHLAASVAFSLLHVGGMVALRMVAYRVMGESYSFGDASEFLYEYRKDVTVYLLIAAIGWVVQRLDLAGAAPAVKAPAASPAGPADDLLEIRDGSRLVIARRQDILYARAEGNYVAFTLADGREPLMRATLTAVEQRLSASGASAADPAAGGFVRTHRSWLVNLSHVQESEPTGSGDFVLRMANGKEVPLSRRYSEAVRLIRKRPSDLRHS